MSLVERATDVVESFKFRRWVSLEKELRIESAAVEDMNEWMKGLLILAYDNRDRWMVSNENLSLIRRMSMIFDRRLRSVGVPSGVMRRVVLEGRWPILDCGWDGSIVSSDDGRREGAGLEMALGAWLDRPTVRRFLIHQIGSPDGVSVVVSPEFFSDDREGDELFGSVGVWRIQKIDGLGKRLWLEMERGGLPVAHDYWGRLAGPSGEVCIWAAVSDGLDLGVRMPRDGHKLGSEKAKVLRNGLGEWVPQRI